jgi:hypothetical protein
VDAKTVDVRLVLFSNVDMSEYQKEFLFNSLTILNDPKNEHQDNDSILIVVLWCGRAPWCLLVLARML